MTPANRNKGITPFYVMELLARAKRLEAQGRSIIHMEIGEPDFSTPRAIIDAGIRLLETGSVKYTPAAGLPELREKIADFYQRRYQVKVDARRIFITPGASGALLLALAGSFNPAEQLLMADPCYPCNGNFVRLFDGIVKAIPVDAHSQYQLTSGSVRANWEGGNSRGVLIASPSNPTGTLISDSSLAQIIHAVEQLGGLFYSDEIYHGLVYDKQAVTALAISDQVFVINSFSKYFAMTGWRVGWLVVPEMFIEVTERLAQNLFIATATHSQYAALAALEPSTQIELDARRDQFALRRDFLYQGLIDLGFEIPVKPDGAFYLYADCTKFTDDSFQLASDLLELAGVAVTPGKDFGTYQAQRYLRFAYTTSIENMAIALQRIADVLEKR